MNTIDTFMQDEFMPFYRRAINSFKRNHHMFYSIANSFLSGQDNHIGLRIMENNKIAGDYTLYLAGANIIRLDNDTLSSEMHTPFGIIKPYAIIEKNALERMIADEENFIKDPFTTKMKYLHETTIKFFKS